MSAKKLLGGLVQRPKYHQGKCVPDKEISNLLETTKLSLKLCDVDISAEFLSTYADWIKSTKKNKIIELDRFEHINYAQGTTESFDKFYIKHHDKRFRIWKGEYAYHKIMFEAGNMNWSFLDDEDLQTGDAVIISIPFADSGNVYKYAETLEAAEKLNIPVLVDCAWFGTCSDITFDLSYECIDQVVFSMSKVFPTTRHRIGIRFSNQKDGLDELNRVNFINNFSQHAGLMLLKKYSPDHIVEKYLSKQIDICKELKVKPSQCVNLALGGDEWLPLNRGGIFNRLCLSDELIK